MLIVTWNVNSLKIRMPRVLEFLQKHRPDVLCVQETKVATDAFPHMELQAAGYRAIERSSGRWTGVALIVRIDAEVGDDVCRELPGEPLPDEARWVEATVNGVRVISVYVINGRALDDPMFAAKLQFLDAMERRLTVLADTGIPFVVTGDFNIAPADVDVWNPAAWQGSTHVTPEERGRLERLLALGAVDAYRHLDPEGVHYTWWDYRGGSFHRGFGLRIDLGVVSTDLAARLEACGIDRDFRKGEKPSDHAPLLMHFRDA